MKRRSRIYVQGVGLTAALLTGCLGTSAVSSITKPAPTSSAPAKLTASASPSSYHAHVAETLPQETPAPIKQARFPEPTPPPPPEPVVVLQEAQRPPEAPLVQALRCVLNRQPSAALDLLQQYDPASRDLVLALLQMAAPLCEDGEERTSPQKTAALLEQLTGIQANLRKRAPLGIEKMCFCREIRNFGKYDPLPPDYAFQVGSEGRPGERVQVYVEVRNFICRPRNDAFETALQGHVEIHDFRNQCVWQQEFRYNPDRSRTPRQDYYLAFLFNVPPGLSADSSYTLWVYVKDVGDENVQRVARRSLDFRVHPPRRPVTDAARSAQSIP